MTSFPEGFHLDLNPRKPVPVSNPGFNNFRKCFKYTKYNGEYNSHSQATVAQGIRGFASIPRVTYRWGSNPTMGNFSNMQKTLNINATGLNTKYNGEYNCYSQATVAQWIRGFASIPRVTYRWGSNPTVGNFSNRQKYFGD